MIVRYGESQAGEYLTHRASSSTVGDAGDSSVFIALNAERPLCTSEMIKAIGHLAEMVVFLTRVDLLPSASCGGEREGFGLDLTDGDGGAMEYEENRDEFLMAVLFPLLCQSVEDDDVIRHAANSTLIRLAHLFYSNSTSAASHAQSSTSSDPVAHMFMANLDYVVDPLIQCIRSPR